jgi:hypothetical protein
MIVEKFDFIYRKITVTIEHSDVHGYCFYSEADNAIYRHYKTRAEALDEALKKADEDADYFGTDK